MGILVVGCALAVLSWRSLAAPGELSVCALSIIPAGIDDDSGAELQLLTLLISNTNLPAGGPNHSMYETVLEQRHAMVEAKLHGAWRPVDGKLHCTVPPGYAKQTLLVVPAGTEAVRVSVTYASRGPSIRWQLLWSVARFEHFIGVRFAPAGFYNWAYQQPTRRTSRWTEQHIEVLLPPKTVAAEASKMPQVL